MVVIVVGFGTIAVIAFIYPFAELAGKDGECKIGLPFRVTIPLLTYDVLINVALTGVFIGLLRPLLSFRNPTQANPAASSTSHRNYRHLDGNARGLQESHTNASRIELAQQPVLHTPNPVAADPNVKALKNLVRRSLIGAGLVLIPTIINMALLYKWRGKEQGWLCFMICTVDGTQKRHHQKPVHLTTCSYLVCWSDTPSHSRHQG